MAVEALEVRRSSLEPDFNNLTVVNGLYGAAGVLRGQLRERKHLQDYLAQFDLPHYVAPEGEGIQVRPLSGPNRIGYLELFKLMEVEGEDQRDWSWVSPRLDRYSDFVHYRFSDPYFIGRSVGLDPIDHELSVYTDDRIFRVVVDERTQFERVSVAL